MTASTLLPPSLGAKGGSHCFIVYALGSHPSKFLGHHKYSGVLTSFDTSYCQSLPHSFRVSHWFTGQSFYFCLCLFPRHKLYSKWPHLTSYFVSCPSKNSCRFSFLVNVFSWLNNWETHTHICKINPFNHRSIYFSLAFILISWMILGKLLAHSFFNWKWGNNHLIT